MAAHNFMWVFIAQAWGRSKFIPRKWSSLPLLAVQLYSKKHAVESSKMTKDQVEDLAASDQLVNIVRYMVERLRDEIPDLEQKQKIELALSSNHQR